MEQWREIAPRVLRIRGLYLGRPGRDKLSSLHVLSRSSGGLSYKYAALPPSRVQGVETSDASVSISITHRYEYM